MCENCGCAVNHHHHHHDDHEHDHDHAHEHDHDHHHESVPSAIDFGRQSLLSTNDRLAARNRRRFAEKGITVINVVSSPGSGKTALLERTMTELGSELRLAAIVGDLATNNDAARLQKSGAPAIQITTGSACHLDAHMIHHALDEIIIDELDLLFIENVGNLVCPASFDLGEDLFVVMLSTTEGEDKPLKYPVIFLKADAVIVNKSDLAAAVEFNRGAALHNIAESAPRARVFETSARSGEGVSDWCNYIRKFVSAKRKVRAG